MIIKTCDNITKLAWINQKLQIRLTRITWALSSTLFSTWLVTTQVLDEVEASLLEQQGKESNSSQDVPILRVDELLGLAHGNIAFLVEFVLLST